MKKFPIFLAFFISVSSYAIKDTSESHQANNDNKTTVSTGQYITGGLVGSFLGFGIGHAIQGRYLEKGYIFTLGETVIPLIMAPVLYNLTTTKAQRDKCVDMCGFGSFITVALGFRVWEIFSLWGGARPIDKDSSEAILFFDYKEPKLSLVLTF